MLCFRIMKINGDLQGIAIVGNEGNSFYYFNDEIPTDADFEKTVGDYLSFEFSMIMQGRRYLFENIDSEIEAEKADNVKKNFKLSDREWKEFRIGDLFGKRKNSKLYHLNN